VIRLSLRSAVLLLPLSLAAAARAETVTLKADVWCPYNCDPKTGDPGYMVEIAKAALEPLGHKVDYQTLNWARAIVESRNGAFAGIIGAAKNDAPDFVFPENSLGRASNCFFVKPDSAWTFKDMASLPSVTIGAIKDYSYEDSFDEYVKKNAKDAKKIDFVSGDTPLELNLKKVAMGRITAFIEDSAVLENHLATTNQKGAVKPAGCIKEADVYVAFSPKLPKSKEYAKAVSDKVAAMRKDGSLATLLKKYGLVDWQK
jgi:polar amino acid transport system substrate-binding protein